MAKRKSKKSYACRKGTIHFRTKRGKHVVFKGKHGKGCSPRKKPSTRHLAKYKTAMAKAARACKGRKGKSFRTCVANRM
jgi:hypothetical protein